MDATRTEPLHRPVMQRDHGTLSASEWAIVASDAARDAAQRWTLAVLRGLPDDVTRKLRSALSVAVHHARMARLAAASGQSAAAVADHARAAESACRAHRRVTAPAGPPVVLA